MNNKKLKILIIVLTILTIGLTGYIIYDKITEKDLSNINDNVEDTKDNEISENEKYKILNDENKHYLVKLENSNYNVIYEFEESYGFHYIGIYNNKLYYSEEDSIKYLVLENENVIKKEWIKIPQYDFLVPAITQSKIIGDSLYFSINSFGGGNNPTDGILKLSMNANDFNEYLQIIDDADLSQWYVNEEENIIYYEKFNYGNGIIPYEYNIKTNEKKQLFDIEPEGILYGNGKILYYIHESDRYDSDWNLIYSCHCKPHYELYAYDINTKKIDLITDNINENKNGNITAIADIANEKIYYYTSNGKIYIYNTSDKSSTEYYTLNNNSSYRGFYFLDDEKTMVIWNDGSIEDQYVVNGKIKDSLENINVVMKDGTEKKYPFKNFNSIYNKK